MNGLGQICDKTKIFGDSESQLITHIVTVAKYVVYESRRKGTRPYFNQFKEFLKRDFQAERFIAAKKSDAGSFNKKWGPLTGDLSNANSVVS